MLSKVTSNVFFFDRSKYTWPCWITARRYSKYSGSTRDHNHVSLFSPQWDSPHNLHWTLQNWSSLLRRFPMISIANQIEEGFLCNWLFPSQIPGNVLKKRLLYPSSAPDHRSLPSGHQISIWLCRDQYDLPVFFLSPTQISEGCHVLRRRFSDAFGVRTAISSSERSIKLCNSKYRVIIPLKTNAWRCALGGVIGFFLSILHFSWDDSFFINSCTFVIMSWWGLMNDCTANFQLSHLTQFRIFLEVLF